MSIFYICITTFHSFTKVIYYTLVCIDNASYFE